MKLQAWDVVALIGMAVLFTGLVALDWRWALVAAGAALVALAYVMAPRASKGRK